MRFTVRVALVRCGGVLGVAEGRSGVEGNGVRVEKRDGGVEGVAASALSGICTGADGDASRSASGRRSPCTIASLSVDWTGDGGLAGVTTGGALVCNTGATDVTDGCGGGGAGVLGTATAGLGIKGACTLIGAGGVGAGDGKSPCLKGKMLSSNVTSRDKRREWVCLSHSR